MNANNGHTYCRVNSDFPPIKEDIMIIRKGEILTIEKKTNRHWSGWKYCKNICGESGWVPERYLIIEEGFAKVIKNYAYKELPVSKGEELYIEKEISGWLWCLNTRGNRGWIPLNNVDRI